MGLAFSLREKAGGGGDGEIVRRLIGRADGRSLCHRRRRAE